MNDPERQESKSLHQHTATYKRSLAPASRKHLFEAANYLLCQLALQIEELERTYDNGGNERQPGQPEQSKLPIQPKQTGQAEEKTPE